MSLPITIEKHNGINVLRDDLLIGGTKSILMGSIVGNKKNIDEFVYASPVYGGFQIALSAYCQSIGKKATIFCAKRNKVHQNTLKCIHYGANVIQVPYGYLTVVEKRARDYCQEKQSIEKIVFGANSPENKQLITNRVIDVCSMLETEPDEIWCAVGSGTLVTSISDACITKGFKTKIYGVQVGAEFIIDRPNIEIIKYEKPFEKPSKCKCPFPSMENYDLKAYEKCMEKNNLNNVVNINNLNKCILFWNVYG
jgi:cysteine synthase